MFANVLMLALLVAIADGTAQAEKTTTEPEVLTTLTVDDMDFTARTVKFHSESGVQTCTLEGAAKLRFGDIAIEADSMQCSGKPELRSLTCIGNCKWQQDDGSGEILRADKLELQSDGLRLSGNASLQYGSGQHSTVITSDSIIIKHGNKGYEFGGNVRLRRSE